MKPNGDIAEIDPIFHTAPSVMDNLYKYGRVNALPNAGGSGEVMMIADDSEEKIEARQNSSWAPNVRRIKVTNVPVGTRNLNIDGRELVSPLQGFGQLWMKTFKIRLPDVKKAPAEVMQAWKAHFPEFQPPENHFFPSMEGIQPGQLLWIDATVPPLPGMPSFLPVSTGVIIIYADDVSFTVMNPEGHPLSGWNTFSIHEEDGCLVAQIQEQTRASDPMYEFFFNVLGSTAQQDNIWTHVLRRLAEYHGITGQDVTITKTILDPKRQWKESRNIFKNAAIRTVFYLLAWPFRQIKKLFSGKK